MINEDYYLDLRMKLNDNCTLVAVSKTKPIEAIKALYDLGHRDFGENRVQELVQKQSSLPKDIRWHLIGPLQRNKVNKVVGITHLIHTISDLSIAKKIDNRASQLGIKQNILIQINIDEDENKSGLKESDLDLFLNELKNYENLKIKGIMTIGINTDDTSIIRNTFSSMKHLYNKLKHDNNLEYLSMGMSSDYNIALEESSNMIRVGSAIFGSR